ncbi:EamA family transporter RarD [Brevibacterium salitolerans]|uniref:EamA family transporter RarD n=1 Tax=Brevibacterium salitolerans TaxID=1403566 RepID=UPI0031E27659
MNDSSAPAGLPEDEQARRRAGLLSGMGAYLLWGLLPLYFSVLAPADSFEILAHRIVWCTVFCLLLLALTGGFRALRTALTDGKVLGTLALAAVLVCGNWLVFLLGVMSGNVVEISLGYYINPLLSILLGVFVLRERLRPLQWVAIGLAAAAVVVITVGYGAVPWFGLAVAVTFAGYGLVKNRVGAKVGALSGLTVESIVLTPLALGWIGWTYLAGTATFSGEGSGHVLLMLLLGPATALPLLLFGSAARRIPLSWVGMLQYVTPTMQFLTGVFLMGEEMSAARWAGFGLIWVACLVLITDMVRRARRR